MNTQQIGFIGFAFAILFTHANVTHANAQHNPLGEHGRGQSGEAGGSTGALSLSDAVDNMLSPDKDLRLAAILRLSTERGEFVQRWLVYAARNDAETENRLETIRVLRKRRELESIPILKEIKNEDRNPKVRDAAKAAFRVAKRATKDPENKAGRPPWKNANAWLEEEGGPTEDETAKLPNPPLAGGDTQQTYYEVQEQPAGSVDDELITSTAVDEVVPIYGFLPSLGYEGAVGMPRDTVFKTALAAGLGLEMGRFDNRFGVTQGSSVLRADNAYAFTDFSLVISGRYSPIEFLELGGDFEVFTYEDFSHLQRWTDDMVLMPRSHELYQDQSYGGGAMGFLSANIKALFFQDEKWRVGAALRLTLPTHTGKHLDRGVGATQLYDPTYFEGRSEPYPTTSSGKLWGLEPGVIASYIPMEHLTVYADLNFMMMFLKYSQYSDGTQYERRATNIFLVPNLGAQYRLLDDALGVQLALQPMLYLGKDNEKGLGSFGLVPGANYRLFDMIELALTVNVEAGRRSANPFVCGNQNLVISDADSRLGCGAGRRFGVNIVGVYDF